MLDNEAAADGAPAADATAPAAAAVEPAAAAAGLRKFLSLDAIVQACQREIRQVDVDGVGTFFMLELTARERETFATKVLRGAELPPAHWNIAVLVATLCDETGKRLWKDGDDLARRYDATVDSEFSAAFGLKLGAIAQRLNGFVVDTEKNSVSIHGLSSA